MHSLTQGRCILKIGELAAATGLSVRTLHHYDEIGLLSPSDRTDSNHRVYTRDDLARLQNIIYLKQLGLSLDDIRTYIDGADRDRSLEILDSRIARFEKDLSEMKDTLAHLRASRETLAQGRGLATNDIVQNLREAVTFEKYYSPEQLAELKKRADTMGPEKMQKASADWAALIAKVKDAVAVKMDPKSSEARALADEWHGLIQAFSGGNQAVEQNASKMYSENPDMATRYGMDKEIFLFIKNARP
jgi:DNA-binding transcriptional MerR regulator